MADLREQELNRQGLATWENLLKTAPEGTNPRRYAAGFAALSVAWYVAKIREQVRDIDDAYFRAQLASLEALYGGKQVSAGMKDSAKHFNIFSTALRQGLGNLGEKLSEVAIQAGMNSTKEERARMGNSQMETQVVLNFGVPTVGERKTLQEKIAEILK